MSESFQMHSPLFSWLGEPEHTSFRAMVEPDHILPLDAKVDNAVGPLMERGASPCLRALFAPLDSIKGLGPRGLELLTKLLSKPSGAPKVIDLLWHLPSGYLMRPLAPSIKDAPTGGVASLVVTPVRYKAPPKGAARAPFTVVCEDHSGTLEVIYFHGDRSALRRLYPLGEPKIISGPLDRYGSKLQMAHPDYALALKSHEELPAIEPIYPLTLGLTQKFLRRVVGHAMSHLPSFAEWIEEHFLARQGWPAFDKALRVLHQPQSEEDLELWGKARERLAFDEVYASQLALALVRREYRQVPGRQLLSDGRIIGAMRAALPYKLTSAQERALGEILADMAAPHRMLRLLQGDVGSGKTVVAALAMAAAVEAGTQTAFMAPTDVLARQHLETLAPLCEAGGVRLGYLSGREQGRARKAILAELAEGRIQALIGTHALFQEDVAFLDLGLAVIDEQHRFGVAQRLALQQKSKTRDVDILLMTATPIPRTLLLTLHGDLDVSRLTEKPAGRKPVATRAVPIERIGEVIEGLGRAFKEGAQAYWVCPAVESDPGHEMAAVEARAAHLAQVFGDKVGFVHGKLPGPKKDAAIAAFTAREISLLVATTVIEVGVNVPSATVMIIENAEMFGLAQLHQLRGRVGRGTAASSCVLLYKGPLSETAKARLDIMRQTDDGFVIAEEDLRLRGGGELLGERQSGDPGFKLAPWPLPAHLIERAADHAKYVITRDPNLRGRLGEPVRILLTLFEREDAVELLKAG